MRAGLKALEAVRRRRYPRCWFTNGANDTQREALQTLGIKQIYEIRKLDELTEIASVPIEDH